MTERIPLPRRGHVTICDQVRREDNGKEIYLGVYAGTIVVPVAPFILPSLAFAFTVAGEADDRPQTLKFQVTFPPNENFEFEIPVNEIRNPAKADAEKAKANYFRLAMTIQIADLILPKAGPMNVMMEDERGKQLIARYQIVERAPQNAVKEELDEIRRQISQRIALVKAQLAMEVKSAGELSVKTDG